MATVGHVVIAGAGECGTRTALALRGGGFAGQVTLVGDEAVDPYERPQLSKGYLASGHDPIPLANKDALNSADIAFLSGFSVQRVDRAARHVVLSGGRSIGYDHLVLATGCRSRRLDIADHVSGVCYLRSLKDAAALKAAMSGKPRIAIIGAGFIGLEVAGAARARGCDVTVLETQPRILGRGVGPGIAEAVAKLHRQHGVVVNCAVSIAAMDRRGGTIAIELGDGRTMLADLVLVGIGAIPNVELAVNAGLAVDNGISVNGRLETSDPFILAAGDCCSFPLAVYGGRRVRLESWRNAVEHADLAARNILGEVDHQGQVPWFWSDQFDHCLHVCGLVDEGRNTVRRDLGSGAVIDFHLADDGRLVAAAGFGPAISVAKDIRLAEMLIAAQAKPDPDQLSDPELRLKTFLAR